jgi:hypothetical protein
LRFINQLYKTKEVCLAAVAYEASHTSILNDFWGIPLGNLDYVYDHMKIIKKDDVFYLGKLEGAYLKKKRQQPGYYGKLNTYQDMLAHYNANTYDEFIYNRYLTLNTGKYLKQDNMSDSLTNT